MGLLQISLAYREMDCVKSYNPHWYLRLHPLSFEIIDEASATANESISFPADFFGPKQHIVNWMAIFQGVGLIFFIWVSVFKPWNKKNNSLKHHKRKGNQTRLPFLLI